MTHDVLIVGAGFAGLYMLHKCKEIGLSAVVVEAGSDVGGTWYWNRYPGARCDVESFSYSYSFSEGLQQEWSWSERYPAQPEILRYLEHVADRFALWPDIQLRTRVVEAAWDDAAGGWTIGTEAGDTFSARWCVMATGCLSASQVPQIPGLERFEGEWWLFYHDATLSGGVTHLRCVKMARLTHGPDGRIETLDPYPGG